MTKVVSIKAHPKYRDHASLRQYLAGGQDEFGTKVDMSAFYDLDNPEVQHQLKELNLWCEAMKEIGPGVIPKPKLVDLSDVILVPVNKGSDDYADASMLHYEDPPPIDMEPHLVKNLLPSPGVDGSRYVGRTPGKSLTTDKMLSSMFPHGIKPGEFYAIRAITSPYDVLREGVNIVIQNKMQYMVRGHDDANPTS